MILRRLLVRLTILPEPDQTSKQTQTRKGRSVVTQGWKDTVDRQRTIKVTLITTDDLLGMVRSDRSVNGHVGSCVLR